MSHSLDLVNVSHHALQVLAGYDGGLDPRQDCTVTSKEYTKLVRIAFIQTVVFNCVFLCKFESVPYVILRPF